MKSKSEAYALADKINTAINSALGADPVTQQNVINWHLFVRTVRTTLDILDSVCTELMSVPSAWISTDRCKCPETLNQTPIQRAANRGVCPLCGLVKPLG